MSSSAATQLSDGNQAYSFIDGPLGIQQAYLVDLLDTSSSRLRPAFFAASSVSLFTLGSRLDAAYPFIERLAQFQAELGQDIPLLIMAGLCADSDLAVLDSFCQSKGLHYQIRLAAVTDDALTLTILSSFLNQTQSVTQAMPAPVTTDINQANPNTTSERNENMASINDSLNELMKVDGAMAAALVDSNTGMVMGKVGGGINLDAAGAGNAEVVKAKLKTMKMLGLNEAIEDMLITLGSQYHIIRPMAAKPTVFLYFVLDKSKASLGLARFKIMEIEKGLQF